MKILFITHFFPPTHNAGTENYTDALARTFKARGHDTRVLCAGDWESGEAYWNGVTEDVHKGVPVHRLHLNWARASDPNRVLYQSQQVCEWLDRFLDRARPDVVHVTSSMTLGAGVLFSVRDKGIPLVLTLMDFWFLCPSVQLRRTDGSLCEGNTTGWQCQSCLSVCSRAFRACNGLLPEALRSRFWGAVAQFPLITRQRGFRGLLLNVTERKTLLERALSIPDRILAHSRSVQEMFASNKITRVQVLPNGHDLSWHRAYKGKTPSQVTRLGYFGQIQPNKGIHVLIKAFKRAKLRPRARLDIWGDLTKDRHYTERLFRLIDGDAAITLRGQFDHDNLADVLANIDVLVVPSLWYENSPLVIQEAFACKTPVITTNLGGMAAAVTHEVNGLLFERGNREDLARQLQRVTEEPGLLTRLSAGVPPVKTIDEEAAELEVMYAELVSGRREHVT